MMCIGAVVHDSLEIPYARVVGDPVCAIVGDPVCASSWRPHMRVRVRTDVVSLSIQEPDAA